MRRFLIWLCLLLAAHVAVAQDGFDVHVLGEVHDNPDHHIEQALRVAALQPKAVVFEMLDPALAARVTPDQLGDAERLGQVLRWSERGWPDLAMYLPIFQAATNARIYGAAVDRSDIRRAMQVGAGEIFGAEATRYGLVAPLPQDQQAAREALQKAAHCDALSQEMLPLMVEVQRLRDAVFARAVVQAWADTGGPVVLITGNGHARRDWGVPAVLAQVAPDLRVFALGQGEENLAPEGSFDEVVLAPAPMRDDPCDVFR